MATFTKNQPRGRGCDPEGVVRSRNGKIKKRKSTSDKKRLENRRAAKKAMRSFREESRRLIADHDGLSPTRARLLRLMERDGPFCHWCRDPLTLMDATTDHVLPRARGGGSESSNLVACCQWCNNKKGDMTPEEFKPILAELLSGREGGTNDS